MSGSSDLPGAVRWPIPATVESMGATEILRLALETLGEERLALSASFGPEDVVLLDLLAQLTPRPRVLTLDTGRLPQETHDLMDRLRDRFGIEIEVFVPQPDVVEAMVRERGTNLFLRTVDDRRRCCDVRKVDPLGRALATVDGWVTGLRRDQTSSRAAIRKVGPDLEHGMIWKIAPLADWTEPMVWAQIQARDLPVNALHGRGYGSIGCAPCTRPVEPGADPRSGRWWWEDAESRECGLHLPRHTAPSLLHAGER